MKIIYEERDSKFLFPYCFRICNDRIEAYFWPFKYIISSSDIEEIKIIEKIPWWIGWGLRIKGRSLYFAIHHKRSIEIRKKKGFWEKVILSVKDPEKFLSKLKVASIL